MKQLSLLTVALCTSCLLALTTFAGPESLPSGKEMKQVAPAPPPCDWTGFYIGLNVGGQFGHAEDKDLDGYNTFLVGGQQWGYGESGVVAGGQVGYNYQWHCLVLGFEADGGYMDLDGSGVQPGSASHFGSDTRGISDSDFYTTVRGRLGLACHNFLFYGTGGGIGVNWETRVRDDCDVFPCGGDLIDAHKTEFQWGWTGGGGLEYMFNCHWSVKAEYLYFDLGDQAFTGEDRRGVDFRWRADVEGHIVRAGLNYKF